MRRTEEGQAEGVGAGEQQAGHSQQVPDQTVAGSNKQSVAESAVTAVLKLKDQVFTIQSPKIREILPHLPGGGNVHIYLCIEQFTIPEIPDRMVKTQTDGTIVGHNCQEDVRRGIERHLRSQG